MTKNINKSAQITEGVRKSFKTTDCKMANHTCYGYDTMPNGDLMMLSFQL